MALVINTSRRLDAQDTQTVTLINQNGVHVIMHQTRVYENENWFVLIDVAKNSFIDKLTRPLEYDASDAMMEALGLETLTPFLEKAGVSMMNL